MPWLVDLVPLNQHITIITRGRQCLVPSLSARDGANVRSYVVETKFNIFDWIGAN